MIPTTGAKSSITTAAALALTLFTAPSFADHVKSSSTAATVVYFYSGEWWIFTPALTKTALRRK